MQKQPNSRHCFVCGLENPYGLKLKFYQTAPGEVSVHYRVPEQYQGYPGIVHGGVVAAILDETAGRTLMGVGVENPRFMYTARLTVHYRQNVPVDQPLRIVGRAVKDKARVGTAEMSIFDADGVVLVEAEALLVAVPDDKISAVDLEALGWKIYPDEPPDPLVP